MEKKKKRFLLNFLFGKKKQMKKKYKIKIFVYNVS